MTTRIAAMIAGLAFAGAAELARGDVPTPIALPIEAFTVGTLEVVLEPDPQAFSVAVHTWYPVGSDDDARGIPAVIEHLMVRGSKHLPDGRYEQLIDAAGGWSNTSLAADHTSCVAHVPAGALALVLQLEAERLFGLADAFDQRRLDEVRAQLRTQRADVGAELAIRKALYPGRPEALGDPTLDRVSVTELARFWRAHYRSGARIVIAGRFDPRVAHALIQRDFGWMPEVPRTRPPALAVHPLAGAVELALRADIPATKLVVAFRTDDAYTTPSARLAVAARLLGEGKGSRLYRRLVVTSRLATDVRVDVAPARGGGVFTIEVALAPGADPQRVRVELFEELATLRTIPVASDELARANTALDARLVVSLENLAFRAETVARWMASAVLHDVAAIRHPAVSPEELRATAATWLAETAAVIATITPGTP